MFGRLTFLPPFSQPRNVLFVPKADIAAYSMTSSALRKAQALKPSMIKLGSRHAAMKNNAHETMTKRYVAQDSSDFIVALDRSNSDAAISQATSGKPTPRTNIRSED
jgi:protein-tyrosine-phosphatase